MDDLCPSEPLSLDQLSLFRTELCKAKACSAQCASGERCPYSHCLSWHRRNPFAAPYRPLLCPNTRFWTECRRMKVKTWCRRGRQCLFAHTKEEQMYHPLVYKTQICRDWPGCTKPFCPFAHGFCELRDPDAFLAPCYEGPEMVDDSVQSLLGGEDRLRQEFDRKAHEQEVWKRQIALTVKLLKNSPGFSVLVAPAIHTDNDNTTSPLNENDLVCQFLLEEQSLLVGEITPSMPIKSCHELGDSASASSIEVLFDGSILLPLGYESTVATSSSASSSSSSSASSDVMIRKGAVSRGGGLSMLSPQLSASEDDFSVLPSRLMN